MTTATLTRESVKAHLRNELSKSPLTVIFEKANGEIREMRCTTNLDLVPPSEWPDEKLTEQLADSSATTYRVYDLDKQGWRSFKLDSLITITDHTNTYNIRD